jgi:hypothetical protein
MKKISILLIIAIIAFSCSEKPKKTALQDLINQKNDLSTKIDSLTIQLKSLEQEI